MASKIHACVPGRHARRRRELRICGYLCLNGSQNEASCLGPAIPAWVNRFATAPGPTDRKRTMLKPPVRRQGRYVALTKDQFRERFFSRFYDRTRGTHKVIHRIEARMKAYRGLALRGQRRPLFSEARNPCSVWLVSLGKLMLEWIATVYRQTAVGGNQSGREL